MRNLIALILIFLSSSGKGQSQMLLLDPSVQLECTEAVNDIYNFKFERAQKEFEILKLKYPEHPLPYFLMGLSAWWKMMPSNLRVEDYDDEFLAYMDTSITKAEKIYKNENTKIEGAFFLSGAYGFKAELYGERSNYVKATFAGKNALNYLLEYKDNNDLSPEFLFGLGLYNYYAIWIKEEYPLLKPIIFFFPNGDKEKGIKQLKEVADNAFYTRTEAQSRLVKILLDDEDGQEASALPFAKYLKETYPDNAYFERTYAKALFLTGNYRDLEPVALDIMQRLDSGEIGYEEISGRYATYYLGQINKFRNTQVAKQYFEKCVYYSEKIEATDKGYYLYSLKNLAEIADKEGNHELAKQYYKKIKKCAPNDEEYLKELKREAKKNLRNKKTASKE